MTEDKNLVIVDNREIQNMIYTIRGKQVMVDSDLATLYQVTTKRLNEQVRRNKNRFPSEFMFRLTAEEYEYLRSQNATSSEDNAHGGRRYIPRDLKDIHKDGKIRGHYKKGIEKEH